MSPSSFDALDWVALGIIAFAVLCLIGYFIAAVVSELSAPKRAGTNARGGVHPHVPAPPRAPVVDIAEWKLPDVRDTRPDRPYLHKVGDVRTSAPLFLLDFTRGVVEEIDGSTPPKDAA